MLLSPSQLIKTENNIKQMFYWLQNGKMQTFGNQNNCQISYYFLKDRNCFECSAQLLSKLTKYQFNFADIALI